MTRKEMPLILMLLAGLTTCLVAYFRGFKLSAMLIALLATLVIFYMLGCIIRMILDSFDKEEDKEHVSDEGEVIEKEPATEAQEEETENPNP